jgi:hypothetical protein
MSAFQDGAAIEEGQEGPGSPLLCWIARMVEMCLRNPTFPRSDVADQFKAKSLQLAIRTLPRGVSSAAVQETADTSTSNHRPWPTTLTTAAGMDVEASSTRWRFCWDTILSFLLQHGPASIVSELIEISCRNEANAHSNSWVLVGLQRFPNAWAKIVSAWAQQASFVDLARLTDLLLSSTFEADSDLRNAAEDALGVIIGLLQEVLCFPKFGGDERSNFVRERGHDLCARLYEQCTELLQHNSAPQLRAKLLRLLLWALSRRTDLGDQGRAQLAQATELLVGQLTFLMQTGASKAELIKLAYLLNEECGHIVEDSCEGDAPASKVEKFVQALLNAECLIKDGISKTQVEAGLQSICNSLNDSALGMLQRAIGENCDLVLKLLSVSEVGIRQQGVDILTKVFDLSSPEAAILQESFGSMVTSGSAGERAAQSTAFLDFFGTETHDGARTARRGVSKQTRKAHFTAILESPALKSEPQGAPQASLYKALGIEPPDGPGEQAVHGQFSLVMTDTVKENLRKVLDSYRNTTPLLLEGGTGVGKVCLLALGPHRY